MGKERLRKRKGTEICSDAMRDRRKRSSQKRGFLLGGGRKGKRWGATGRRLRLHRKRERGRGRRPVGED